VVRVLVVGAGPTGLTLACDLARRGVDVRIIDRAARAPVGSRGKALQPRSLEVLDDLGVLREILDSGNQHLVFRHYQRDRVIREVDPVAGHEPTPEVPYPRPLLIPQWRVEQILRARLAELGVRVEWGSELVGFTQSDSGVVATAGGARIEADYLVGCDGGKSGIRKALGVSFVGQTRQEQVMLLGDVEVDGLPADAWHQWFTDIRALLLCPLPGTNAWQFQANPDGSSTPSLATFQRIVDDRTGMPIKLSNPTWLSTYRVNVRMVDRMRVGRVFLAGDAAHVHSIAGGLGMNTGIQDAYNLGWKLGRADDALLDTYQEERLPVAAWTLQTSSSSQRAIFTAGLTSRGGVDAGLTADTRQLDLHYRWSALSVDLADRGDRLRAGDRAPDAPIRTSTVDRLFDVLRGPEFTLLGFGPTCAETLRRVGHLVNTRHLTRTGATVDHAFRAYGIHDDTLILVRPDGHIGLTAVADDAQGVLDYLNRWAPGQKSLRGAPFT
jgi:2-polyprenyl-6-methoxyphenol hydroxylase-like FAD-dependent oxidoreductase